MKAKRIKHRKIARKTGVQPLPPSQPEREEACRALFGVIEERGASDKQYERSIEDPLGDWPENSGEPDQWLLERREESKGGQER